jgi:hypothetical protein
VSLGFSNTSAVSLVMAAVWAYGSAPAGAQAAAPLPVRNAQPATSTAPVAYSSVNQLNDVLGQVDQASRATQADLAKLRVDHWKGDAGLKRQMQSNVESIQRNLQSALPEIVGKLRASPEDLNQTFQLYRNLDALYDVFGSLVESAGAFGNKDEFHALSADLDALENSRRALAQRMNSLTAAKDAELGQLRDKVKELTAAAPPPAVTKKVVDDTEEAPKPAKKKATKKKTTTTPPSTSPPAPSNPPPQ